MREQPDVIVVGAGVAGLVAAHELTRAGLSVRVLECEDEPGGRARTGEWAGCRIEQGAVYFTTRYRQLRRVVKDLGIANRVVPLPNAFRSAIRRDERWHHVDYQSFLSVARFSGIGLVDKASLAAVQATTAAVRPRMRFGDMASAAALDGRRIPTTAAAHRYFTSPVIEVFCGYRPEDVTLPLVALAAWYPGRALTFDGGIGTFTRALADRVEVEYGVEATAVAADDGGATVEVRGGARRASAVVLATPADVSARLWRDAPQYVRSVDYRDMALLYMRTSERVQPGYRRGRDLYMQVMPEPEPGSALRALCFLNDAAPDGGLVLAAATPEARASLDDEELARRLRAEAEALDPGLGDLVVDELVARRSRVVAAFGPGDAARAAAFRDAMTPGPIQLAGDYTHGVWMESAVQSGQMAAKLTSRHLGGGS